MVNLRAYLRDDSSQTASSVVVFLVALPLETFLNRIT